MHRSLAVQNGSLAVIELLLFALLQSAEPVVDPETPPTEHVEVVAPAAEPEEEESNPDNRIECRTGQAIDSRVREARVCQTPRQRRRQQQQLQRLQDDMFNPEHGCRTFGC